MSSRGTLHRYATATTIATFALLIAGGLVTSTDSGLAVPDWPLSYGTWFPPMVGGIRYEHGHRMIAGTVGLMIFALAVWLWRVEPRRWVRRLGYSALTAVFAQAWLGGLTVLLLLPPSVSIAHACLGQAVFSLVVCLAACTSAAWEEQPEPLEDHHAVPTRSLATAVAGLAAIQLLLGATVRHTGGSVHAHLGGGVLLALTTVWLVGRLGGLRHQAPASWRLVLRFGGLLVLQVILGGLVLVYRASVGLRTGHVAIGALLLSQTVLLAWETARRIAPVPSAVARRPMTVEADP